MFCMSGQWLSACNNKCRFPWWQSCQNSTDMVSGKEYKSFLCRRPAGICLLQIWSRKRTIVPSCYCHNANLQSLSSWLIKKTSANDSVSYEKIWVMKKCYYKGCEKSLYKTKKNVFDFCRAPHKNRNWIVTWISDFHHPLAATFSMNLLRGHCHFIILVPVFNGS